MPRGDPRRRGAAVAGRAPARAGEEEEEMAVQTAETLRDRLLAALRVPQADRRHQRMAEALAEQHPADVAEAMAVLSYPEALAVFNWLDNDRAAEVLDEVDADLAGFLVENAPPGRIADLLDRLPMDDAAEVVAEADPEQAQALLADLSARAPEDAAEVRELLSYPEGSAGRLMTDKFVRLSVSMSVDEALAAVRRADPEVETVTDLYVVEPVRLNGHAGERLIGVLSLRELVLSRPDQAVRDLMTREPVTVTVDTDQQDVARLISKYDFRAVPVLDRLGYFAGIITVDDVIDVLVEEFNEDYMRLVGSDAEEMARRTPAQVARLRLPWLMTTMLVELLAGVVIHLFDRTLASVLLLASFMPIISAISGNTGLQSATIIVRGLATGHTQIRDWSTAVRRQVETTLILGGACGLALGVIGGIWYGRWTFGLIVCLGMFIAVNIAGVVGTVVPLASKRLGFDPALTAGPFETAFQDVVGISVFLGLATMLLHWLR
jgi:magnesium transporter